MQMHKGCITFGFIVICILCFLSLGSVLTLGILIKTYSSPAIRVKSYVQTTCKVTAASIITLEGPPANIYCLNTKYIVVWKSVNGQSILESPITASNTYNHSLSQLNDYQLNTNLECMCDSYSTTSTNSYLYPEFGKFVPCNFYTQCYLNVEIVEFMKSQVYFDFLADIFIYAASSALFIYFVIVIIACVNVGLCRKCKRKGYDDLDIVITRANKPE